MDEGDPPYPGVLGRDQKVAESEPLALFDANVALDALQGDLVLSLSEEDALVRSGRDEDEEQDRRQEGGLGLVSSCVPHRIAVDLRPTQRGKRVSKRAEKSWLGRVRRPLHCPSALKLRVVGETYPAKALAMQDVAWKTAHRNPKSFLGYTMVK